MLLMASALVAVDPSAALWLSPPLALAWLLASGLTKPVEDFLCRLRRRFAPRPIRAEKAVSLPALPDVMARVGRFVTLDLAVRPPPAHLLSSPQS